MLKLYNTLTKQKEEFEPINPGKVSMYSCGPTVYSYIHIGNLRTYTASDVLRRYLEYIGFEVRAIQNITDVGHLTDDDIAQGDSGDDKMEKAATKEKKTPEEIARFYENYAKETELELNILPAQFFPRATEHIPQMITIIEELLKKGFAYEKNGNVFFDVTTFDDYGKLSGNTLDKLNIGARLSEPHPDKKNQWDFALWLKASDSHIMKWDSPWSVGYPGWHIECSAMSMEYLGETFDIHTGGEDNIFPHHEAEKAQSECANGQKFVNYWVHTRHLLFDGEKMSKSKGTLLTLEDIKEKNFDAQDLRIAFLSSQYNSQMNFTWKVLEQAKKNKRTLQDFITKLNETESVDTPKSKKIDVASHRDKFENAMNDDLNTPLALSVLFSIITQTNSLISNSTLYNVDEIKAFCVKAYNALGIDTEIKTEQIPVEITKLAQERKTARLNKNYKLSDKLRDEIKRMGYEIKDIGNEFELNRL
ncbi:MAG TPA: cysteine--tRNA ligase [Candidatus Pacebacteria bacterium]|nr:cysteine--tRNA ligase [Candidatus Paceibacterota bacterium]